jgi:multiple sugar transport system substrate-binding protein
MTDSDNTGGSAWTTASNRRTFLKTLGVTGVVGLAGCAGSDGGDGNGDGGETGNGGGSGSAEVHFITEESAPASKEFINTVASEFTEQTDIPVTTEFTGLGTSFDQRIATLVRTGNAPEVALAPGYVTTNWIRRDIAAPVTGVVEAVQNQWDDEYRDIHRLQFEGEDWIVPLNLNPSMQTYRTDLYEQAGVSSPTTFAEEREVVDALANVVDEDGAAANYGFSSGLVGTATTHHRLDVNGVDMLEHSGDDTFSGFEVVLDQGENRERAIEALEHARNIGEHSINSSLGISSWASSYFTGKTAIGEYGGARPLTAAYRENPEVAQKSMLQRLPHGPSGDDPTYFSFLEGLVVMQNAKFPDAGRQFVEFLTTTERIFDLLLTFAPLHNAPVLDSIYEDERYRDSEYMNENNVPDEVLDVIRNDVVPRAEPRYITTGTPNPYIGALQGTFAIGQMGNAVVVKGQDPGAAVDEAASTFRDTLSEVQE